MAKDLFESYLKLQENPLIQAALTDASFRCEYQRTTKCIYTGATNAGLATLGDALLKAALCEILFSEGEHRLSACTAYLTNQVLVEKIGAHYDIVRYLRYDQRNPYREETSWYQERYPQFHPKWIATAVEAVLGAIFLISGRRSSVLSVVRIWMKIIDAEQ